MARPKMIKEVEFTFSPAFSKAINGVKKTKTKTAKAKPVTKKRKAKATKPATAKVIKPKATRGYKIVKVERELTLDKVKDVYELYELTGKGLDQPKYFVSEDYAKQYIERMKNEDLQTKALAGKTHGGPMARAVVSEMKEMQAQSELPEMDYDRAEKCDKTSIEDVDA